MPTPANSTPTKIALLAGTAYFCCMAVAHFFAIKLPILFVYYDTPYHAYQDKIISFAVCAYALLFHAASRHRPTVPHAIIALAITVIGLCAVNLSAALASVMQPDSSTAAYWLQTGGIFGYLMVLIVLYRNDGKAAKSP